METNYILVRHSLNEQHRRVTIEKKGYDLTNYSYLRMSDIKEPLLAPVAEWVWTEDLKVHQSDGNNRS